MSCTAALLLLAACAPAALPDARPADVGLDAEALARIDGVVAREIEAGRAPGAVVLVVRKGKVAFRKAYGARQLQPAREAMTADTVFDLASLTKPVATASAVMLLVERGKVRLDDPVAKYLPGFAAAGKEKVTVAHLLTHTSGLIADNSLADYAGGKARAAEKINNLSLKATPGSRFIYSDVGFIVLGELVEKVSGEPLDAFCRKNLFAPLGLKDTGFIPAKGLHPRTAPTEKVEGRWLRGTVHDPRARRMGGVAGHAGLFGTADDLAVFAQMLLSGGEYGGKRILAAETVKLMTAPREVPGGKRNLGWDVRTRYSSNRGELPGGFGHTGFTGTSMWVVPEQQLAVIVLANRVHPAGKGNVTRLRSEVAAAAARAVVRHGE